MITNEDTQTRILNAALQYFFSQGIKKTSLDEIATQAGVTRVTVYRYFKNKEKLTYAAFMQIVALFQQTEQNILKQDLHHIEDYLDQITQGLANLPSGDFPKLLQELQILYPETSRAFHQARTESVKVIFNHLFKKGTEEHQLRQGLNPEIVQLYFLEAVINFIENPLLAGQNYAPEEIYSTVKSLFLHGILSKESES